MRYFVKVKNGLLVYGPKEISDSPYESPNTQWSKNQMKLNGFFEVDLSHDSVSEYRDISSPIISEDSVTYPINTIPVSEYLPVIKNKKINKAKSIAEKIVLDKYPVYVQLLTILGVKGDLAQMKSGIQSISDRMGIIENDINLKTTRVEVENYEITFPII